MKTNRRNLFKLLAALPLALSAAARPEPAQPEPKPKIFGQFYMLLCDSNFYTDQGMVLGKWIAQRHPGMIAVQNASPVDIYYLRKSFHDVLAVTHFPFREWYFDAAQLAFKVTEVTDSGWLCKRLSGTADVYHDTWFWHRGDPGLTACVKPIKI